MIFSSVEFFIFLGLVITALGLARRENGRRNLLLFASYVFYGWWDWRFLSLIVFSTVVDYMVGLRLDRTEDPRRRKGLLMVSLVVNLGLLAVFKYANFFLGSLAPMLEGMGLEVRHLNIVLPVGISFYTFQTMSYTIDVYRRKLEVQHNFRDFALFVAFFPQLVAGPIVRGSEFLPQLKDEHPLRTENLRLGLPIFLKGFVKKALFADTLSVFADPVFADPGAYSPLTAWLAVIAYAGQIYYDFSGYSDMAIGVGRMLGYKFPDNFHHPYLSLNITEFWRRWHLSLSRWLRDYLYIPLGGNQKGRNRTYVNLMLTMLLGGLWHGANWTFVVWGGLHGTALAVHKISMELRGGGTERPPSAVRRLAAWAGTFVFVLVTWVFFRSQDFSTAWRFLRKMAFVDRGGMEWYYVQAMVVLVLGALLHVSTVLRHEREYTLDFSRPLAWSVAAVAVLLVLFFAPVGTNPFIYFQF